MAGKVHKDSRIPTPRLLAAARILADLSQDALGELSGVNRTVISRYESGDTVMRTGNLARLMTALRARGVRFTGTDASTRVGVEMDNPFRSRSKQGGSRGGGVGQSPDRPARRKNAEEGAVVRPDGRGRDGGPDGPRRRTRPGP